MTVGFHSPLPPARSGVADYAAALLAALRPLADVRVDAAEADVHLYQTGNNGLHREIYRRALERPGVAVLHDAVLNHFFLFGMSREEYAAEFVYNYGEWHREQALRLWDGRAAAQSSPEYFAWPMLKRIATSSRAVVVHNPAAAAMVRRHAPAAEVHEIPHLFAPPPLPSLADGLRWRQSRGIPVDGFVFAVFGYLRESKRLLAVGDAVRRAHATFPNTHLLLAGEFLSEDLARAARPLLAEPWVRHTGYLSEPEFWLAAQACDACVNLRYPTAGETSGVTIRLMGMSKPVLVTESAETSNLPEAACLRVEPGAAEADSLDHMTALLLSSPGVRGEVGRRASAFIRDQHHPDRVARLYLDVLCAHSASLSARSPA